MARPKIFIRDTYSLEQNPFPASAIAQWGSSDERENGSLYDADVVSKEYAEAIAKFVVGPVDSGSKFHFLWSLGEGEEARGFGKTVLLGHVARQINGDLGYQLLTENEFDRDEASENRILAGMGTFNKVDVTGLAAISLEQVRYLAQIDPGNGTSPMMVLREHFVRDIGPKVPGTPEDRVAIEAEKIRERVKETSLSIGGKTLGSPDRKLLDHFANADWRGLAGFLKDADAKNGFDLLSSALIIAKAGGVKRVLLFIDQVEDFASVDTPKKRRSLEVERFRDIAVETQPFGQMASYVLTMHPAAARSIEEYWSLARLPRVDHLLKQNERITVILKPLTRLEEAERLLGVYMGRFRRKGSAFDGLHPFDRGALAVLMDVSGGRPGNLLKFAHDLIEEGARNGWTKIGERQAREITHDVDLGEELVRTPGRRRIGAVE
ncbi:hypothetical protein NKI12_14290 [Mesorhizobium australicum]|uniref:Uncharacterized protein n=1 Tax=Mesorhizobium australicum TaxID=536018 RepID=A0ACC6T094_9HYPH